MASLLRKTDGVRVLAIVHQADAGPGVFGEEIRGRGDSLDAWLLPETAEPPGDPLGYDAVFVLGGSMNVDEGEKYSWIGSERGLLGRLLERRVPLMGLCLGGQMVSAAAETVPRRAARPEIGWHQVEVTDEGRKDPVFGPLASSFEAFEWHSYEFPLPPGAVALARTDVSLQAARIGELAWAVQFHPEVSAADALHWIEDYETDADAVRIGVDPTALALETEAKIGAFNELGRALCGRWLDVAAARS